MKDRQRLFVRVDATPHTGLGHFMRCLALAEHWRDTGREATFIGRYTPTLAARLANEGIANARLETSHPDRRDLLATLDLVPNGALVVLDGYGFDYEYQQSLAYGRTLLVIDDTGHLPAYAGSMLLNPNIDAERVVYAQAPEHRLLGARYALLRREFRTLRETLTVRSGSVGKLLVSLGGADAANCTLKVLAAIVHADIELEAVRVIVGPLNPHRAALDAFTDTYGWIGLVEDPADMSEQLSWADAAIASAGSIFFELAVLGLPSVLLAVADNQLPVGKAAARLGAAIFAGDARELDWRSIAAVLGGTLGDERQMRSLAANAVKLIDGNGVARVQDALLECMQ